MSPFRPDLVDCWIYRDGLPEPDVLLLRRAPGRILPGLWQCVSGSVEAEERIAMAALRELDEETGFGPDAIDGFYDLDLVNQFHEPSYDAVVSAAVFAVRILPGREPRLSPEHDESRWLPLGQAHRQVVWPAYRIAIERIRDDLAEPERASWFELTPEGARRNRGERLERGERPERGEPSSAQ